MNATKPMKLLVLLCLLAGITILAAPKLHADSDQDISNAAVQLDNLKQQDAADQQAEYDREHPKEYDSTPMGTILGLLVVFGGGFLFIRFLWNLQEPPKR